MAFASASRRGLRPRPRDRAAAGRRFPGVERAGRGRPRHRRRHRGRGRARRACERSKARPGRLELVGTRPTARRSLSTTPTSPTRSRTCLRRCGRMTHGPPHRRLRRRRRPRPRQAADHGRDRRASTPTSSSSPTTIRASENPAAIRAAILAARPAAIEIGDRARGDPPGDRPCSARATSLRRRQGPRGRPDRRRGGAPVLRPRRRPRRARGEEAA